MVTALILEAAVIDVPTADSKFLFYFTVIVKLSYLETINIGCFIVKIILFGLY